MSDERTNIDWPTHELVLRHHLSRSQLLDLVGKTYSEWFGDHGRKHRITGAWLGKNPKERTDDDVELMDLELFWIGWSASVRNDGLLVLGRLHLQDGRVLAGNGDLFVNGNGHFVVRGQLLPGVSQDQFSEIFVS